MSTDILFLAEFAGGSPARSALELATGAAELASQSGGSAVALAYGPGAASGAASLGAHGAARAIVLGDEDRPAITYAPAAIAAARDGGLALLAPATPERPRPRRRARRQPRTCRPSGRCGRRASPTASSRPSRRRSRVA